MEPTKPPRWYAPTLIVIGVLCAALLVVLYTVDFRNGDGTPPSRTLGEVFRGMFSGNSIERIFLLPFGIWVAVFLGWTAVGLLKLATLIRRRLRL